MNVVQDRLPVLVGAGEITHREKSPAEGLEPLQLMEMALRRAEVDSGVSLLSDLGSLDIVCQYSWPYKDTATLLADRLGIQPQRLHYGEVGGESPVRFLHEAGLRIARGEVDVAAVVGAESTYSVSAAQKNKVDLGWTPKDNDVHLVRGPDFLNPVAVELGACTPPTVYPFYENATQAHWGQTPRQAQDESGSIWSQCSAVASTNPSAWSRRTLTPDEITTPTPDNRLIAWPYTKFMVANPLVNMGGAVILTSRGAARKMGIPESRCVYLWGGAAAQEARDYLYRDNYHQSAAQTAVLEKCRQLLGNDGAAACATELYSCFPVVPKMARRVLGMGLDAPLTLTGGLSFFGAPLNNYMTHAIVAAYRHLQGRPPETCSLLYGQGEYVTKHHAVVLSNQAPQGATLEENYSVNEQADALRGDVPPLVTDYEGAGRLETFTILYSRDGVSHGVVIGRTDNGARFMAKVDASDSATLDRLMDSDRTPVGVDGRVVKDGSGMLHWSCTA